MSGYVAPLIVFVSATLCTIGYLYKITKLIGGLLMGTLETKKDTNLTDYAMETLLVVGHLGGSEPALDTELSRCPRHSRHFNYKPVQKAS